MIPRFFIDRPVFAAVISIVIVLCGLVSLFYLPVERSPEITPPTVIVRAMYPGADAATVSESVATPIEEQLSGTENLLYYQSQCSNDGTLSVTVTFEIGTDLDIAAVEVQNRLKRAEPRLPEEVMRQGITVMKRSTNIVGVLALKSTDPTHDALFLSNYANINMLDALKRVPGVGDVMVFGSKDYSMRIWLDPDRLAGKGLTVMDVASAIRDQNAQYAAGRIGAEPSTEDAAFTIPVITRGRLDEPEQYADIILRAEPDGSTVRIKDVGRVEMGSLSYDSVGRMNGQEGTFMLVFLQPGANALRAVRQLDAALAEQRLSFPPGMTCEMSYDTTKFIRVSIEEVATTFLEALLLVMLVVFVFLGSWRATIIPLVAVPVAIVGTFTGMLALGFSVNSLTLFGLVLAIGIVVDDAIVVVENVERIMHEDHLPPREATIKAMDQVTSPLIAIVLALCSVYLPVAFLGGITGVMYRQFAITIAMSVAISGLVALTLSPALCRLLLQPNHNKMFLFRWFDRTFTFLARGYTGTVRWAIRGAVVTVLVFAAVVYAAAHLFVTIPKGFVPQEDQGVFLVAVMLPQGASLARTSEAMKQVEDFLLQQPEVDRITALGGQDFLAGFLPSTSAASMFVSLKDWSERPRPDQHVDSVVGRVMAHFASFPDARVLAFNPPAVMGLGVRAGYELQLESRGVSDLGKLAEVKDAFVAELSKDPRFVGNSSVTNMGQPRIYVDLDRTRAKAMGVSVSDVFTTLQAYLGALYVNDFNKYGRTYRVQLQAEPAFRSRPEDIRKVYVRNAHGDMVELSGLLKLEYQSGPNVVSRFNSYPSIQITGAPQGISTGQAMEAIDDLARRTLPAGYGIEWSGASYQERKAGSQAPYVMAFGLVMVFLVLAAQYERWSLPFVVLMAVPVGVLGALVAIWLRGLPQDIYFEIGMLTLIGLAAKNAILIVEFCAAMHDRHGMGLVDAALEAARLRLRPIVMTSLAFILGVLPLVVSHGAGAAGRHSIGTGVMGGMMAATFLAIVFIPVFYVLVQWLAEIPLRRRQRRATAGQSTAEAVAASTGGGK